MAFLLRDLLFTPSCLGCSSLGEWVCQRCLRDLEVQTGRQIPYVDQVIAANSYESWIKEKVISYKSGEFHLARGLAEVLLNKCLSLLDQTILIPVPSTLEKIKLRQLDTMLHVANQIRLLEVKYKVHPNLNLIKTVSDQVGLSHQSRIENMADAFGVSQKVIGDVILIDDVITTGSTLSAAAKTLKLAGANSVTAVALCSAGKMH